MKVSTIILHQIQCYSGANTGNVFLITKDSLKYNNKYDH